MEYTYEAMCDKWEANHREGWYGFAIGKGWFPRVDRALEEMVAILEENGVDRNLLAIHQIKEKWGGLRFYFAIDIEDNEDLKNEMYDKLWPIANQTEIDCNSICSECGSGDEAITHLAEDESWIVTECKQCAKRHKRQPTTEVLSYEYRPGNSDGS
jgi:hypothetical protein